MRRTLTKCRACTTCAWPSPWVVATAMFLASIGLTIAVTFILEAHIAALETVLGIDQQ